MITLSTIHEKNITRFHRNHYLICVSDLKNTSALEGDDPQSEKHFSIETCTRMYPNASIETKAGVLLTSIQRKIQEGERRFLLVFTDDNRHESMDILNALVLVMNLKTETEEDKVKFDYLRAFANEWTHAILRVESKFRKMEFALKH